MIRICAFCFFAVLSATSPGVYGAPSLNFSNFLNSYLKNSPSGISASLQKAQALRMSEVEQDNNRGEFGLIPTLTHSTRTDSNPQRDIYNRASNISTYYRHELPTGTNVQIEGQKFIANSNPLLQSVDSEYSVGLTQDLYRNAFGKARRSQADRAEVDRQVALMEYRQTEVRVCEEAFSLYTDAYIQQERWKVLRDELADANKAYKIAKKLFKDRLIHKLDFISSQSDFIQTQNDVERAQQALLNSKRQIAIYLKSQIAIDYSLLAPNSFVQKPQTRADKVTLAQDIARKRVDSAELEIDRVKSTIHPELELSFKLGQREGRFGLGLSLAQFNEEYVNASVKFAVPTFNKTNDANLSLALEQRNNAVIQKSVADETQRSTLTNLYSMEELLRGQVLSSQKRLKLLDEKSALAFRQMKVGKMEFENYLLHRNAFRSHQANHLQLQKDLWSHQFAIQKELAKVDGSFCRGTS